MGLAGRSGTGWHPSCKCQNLHERPLKTPTGGSRSTARKPSSDTRAASQRTSSTVPRVIICARSKVPVGQGSFGRLPPDVLSRHGFRPGVVRERVVHRISGCAHITTDQFPRDNSTGATRPWARRRRALIRPRSPGSRRPPRGSRTPAGRGCGGRPGPQPHG